MTHREIAEKHGVSRQRVTALFNQHGSLDEVEKALNESLRPETAGAGHKERFNAAKTRKMEADAEAAELAVGESKRRLVESERVLKAMADNVARARAMLDAAFRSELPAKQGGMPADQIAAMNGERLDDIYTQLAKPLI